MPFPVPTSVPSLRDYMCFEEHVANARARRNLPVPEAWYEGPTFYYSNPRNLAFDGDTIRFPASSTKRDFELELACIISVGGRDISAADAEGHIAGYTILNDWSARDIQRQEMAVGLGPAKGKEFAYTLGPVVVTPDELAEYKIAPGKFALDMAVSVNGVQVGGGNSRDMNWSFCDLIEHASRDCDLLPGDVIGSGTVGTGCLLEVGPQVHIALMHGNEAEIDVDPENHRWLGQGDTVEMSVEGIGTLTNIVA